jgi:outer membrane protein assembly factor BamB
LDGTIYVGVEEANSGALLAFYSDSSLKWRYEIQGVNRFRGIAIAIAADSTIYITGENDYLTAVNADGCMAWSYQFGRDFNNGWLTTPVVAADGTIYCSSDRGTFYAINADGSIKLRYSMAGYIGSSPAINEKGDVLFGSADGYFYALRTTGGG